jgi:hypothetical protein
MNPKQFQKYLDRDKGCVHCGKTEAVAPHHRLNRGMGGSKVRDVPSNIVVLCSLMNGLIESSATYAHSARLAGWKLWSGEEPSQTPLWDAQVGEWVLLGDDYSRAPQAGISPLSGEVY